MKKERLTDEQTYRLLEANNLPFQKMEHFAYFLKYSLKERIVKYLSECDLTKRQLVYLLENASAEVLDEFLRRNIYIKLTEKEQLLIINRGYHEVIMTMFNYGGFRVICCPKVEAAIIDRGIEEEINRLQQNKLSEKGQMMLLKYDREHQTNHFDYTHAERFSNKVELDLAQNGSYEQIREYFGKFYGGERAHYMSELVTKVLLSREDFIFWALLIDVSDIRCNKLALCKYASHHQLMHWLKENIYSGLGDAECVHVLLARAETEALLKGVKTFDYHIRSKDVQKILSLGYEELAEKLSHAVAFSEKSIRIIIEKGWMHIIVNQLTEQRVVYPNAHLNAVFKYGSDKDIEKVLSLPDYRLRDYENGIMSAVIMSGNRERIKMCAKKFGYKIRV